MLSVPPPLWKAKLDFYHAIAACPNKLDASSIKQAEDTYKAAMINSTLAHRADVKLRDDIYREDERQKHLKELELKKILEANAARQNGLGVLRR